MSREAHVRFCESVGGRFPRATLRVNMGTAIICVTQKIKPDSNETIIFAERAQKFERTRQLRIAQVAIINEKEAANI